MALKLKFRTQFPASVLAESPIVLEKDGSVYTFSLNLDELRTSLDPYYLSASIFAEPVLVTTGSATVGAGDAAIAINRVAPSATGLTLPKVSDRLGLPLHIIDWSTSVTDHTITLTPNGTEKIMRAATWPLYSNAGSLVSVTLYPSVVLNGWYIAP